MSNFIAYCDYLIPQSEIGFIGRQYRAFSRLTPHWVCRRTSRYIDQITTAPLILGRKGPQGRLERFLFKQFGKLPGTPDLNELSPVLVHAQFGRGGALALPIARHFDVPLVVTFHGGDANKNKHYDWRPFPTIYQQRMAALKKEAARFVCVSESIRARLIARGFPPDKLTVINYGIDLAPLATEPRRQILFVGRFVEKKGLPYLVEAIRLLRDRGVDVPFVLIGDGPLLPAIKRAARALDQVTFLGWQPSETVRRQMASSLAICVPSVRAADGDAEGLPNVALEGMAAGVPVIASNEAGLGGVVQDRVSGRIVQARNARELAEAIFDLSSNEPARRAMGLAGRRLAEERLSIQGQSRRLEDLFCELIDEQRRHRSAGNVAAH